MRVGGANYETTWKNNLTVADSIRQQCLLVVALVLLSSPSCCFAFFVPRPTKLARSLVLTTPNGSNRNSLSIKRGKTNPECLRRTHRTPPVAQMVPAPIHYEVSEAVLAKGQTEYILRRDQQQQHFHKQLPDLHMDSIYSSTSSTTISTAATTAQPYFDLSAQVAPRWRSSSTGGFAENGVSAGTATAAASTADEQMIVSPTEDEDSPPRFLDAFPGSRKAREAAKSSSKRNAILSPQMGGGSDVHFYTGYELEDDLLQAELFNRLPLTALVYAAVDFFLIAPMVEFSTITNEDLEEDRAGVAADIIITYGARLMALMVLATVAIFSASGGVPHLPTN